MKLAIIRQRYSAHGGAEKFVSRALSALQSTSLDVQLIARKWEPVAGITLIKCDPFYLGRIWRDAGFAKMACATLADQKIDLVQSHERIACCDIYRAGDGVHRVWLQQKSRVLSTLPRLFQCVSPYHWYVKSAEKTLFHSPQLKAVICNSEMVKAEIIEHFDIDPKKLRVIYSGVDLVRFHPDQRQQRSAVLRKLNIPTSSTVYVFIGSGFERKGLATTLKSFTRLNNAAYLIVVGYDKHQTKYQQMATAFGVENRVRFLGAVDDVTPYYAAADVFVQPSLYDPFPNAVLEALASGLPVITSEKTGAAEVIENGVNGYVVDALAIDATADAMMQLQDRPQASKIGAAARNTAENFDMHQMVQKLTALYKELSP